MSHYVKITFICIAIVILFWVGAVISAHCFGFYVNEKDIIITFIGILATFVVINNFYQVEKMETTTTRQIEEMKNTTIDQIKRMERKYKIMNKFMAAQKEVIVANKIVNQNKLPLSEKIIWTIVIEEKKGMNNTVWLSNCNAKIKKISLDANNELKWEFTYENGDKIPFLEGKHLVSIYEDTLFDAPLECKLDNPLFIDFLKNLLKEKN
ncbi:MAG: hypothetical protein ACI30B_08790 [Paludibacteraceae bacterium]